MSKYFFILSGIAFLLAGPALWDAEQSTSEQEKKIAALIGNLGTRHWDKAAEELVEIGEAAIVPLIETVNASSGRPSENAVIVLARIGTPKAIEAVIGSLKNPEFHHRVRAYAAMALGDTGSEEFIVPLIEVLQSDSHWWVRNFAVGALGKIGSERAVDPLIEAMNDVNQYVRRAAVSILGELKPDKAVLPLIEALSDEDWQIRLQVPDILVSCGQRIEEPLLEALKHDDKWVKRGAAQVLGRLGSEKALFPLMSLLEDQERMVSDEAAVALSRINSLRAVEPLLDLLKHNACRVREEAAWVLGEMKSQEAVQSLIHALDDEDTGWMAAVSLGKIGDKRAVGPLKKKMADISTRVGKAAAWALARMLEDNI